MAMPWVLSRCRIVGLRPDLTTPIMPWLSSWNNNLGDLPVKVSQILNAGKPIVRSVTSAATISASGVEWLTHPCRLLPPDNGKRVCFPCMCIWDPDVDLKVCAQPAKSASANKDSDKSSNLLPTHPVIRFDKLELTKHIRWYNLASSSTVHLVTFLAKELIDRSKSNRAILAA